MSKGLEALRKLEKELSEYYGTDIAYYPETFEMFHTIGKELQALEILKSGHWIIEEDFSKNSCFVFGKFPKEKYDLLKEVLKWKN